MRRELREILPGFEHCEIALPPGETPGELWLRMLRRFPLFSIAHTAALTGAESDASVFRVALAIAPARMLAYNAHGDRFHIHPRKPISSLLFLRGCPVHRIHLRPWRDSTVHHAGMDRRVGKPEIPNAPAIAVLSPYLPWPLSHGAAVRIFNLLRESAQTHNLHLFAFAESNDSTDLGPLSGICTSITLVRKPDLGRLRWASLTPPEVLEYATPAMREALATADFDLLQIEFTQLAGYGGDVLVEHDITMDLAAQEHRRVRTLSSAWNLIRWRRYEAAALRGFRAVAVMSDRDRQQIEHPNAHVLANGVDLQRYVPEPECDGERMIFIGSFRHFPNALAYRFLAEEFWPLMQRSNPNAKLSVVAGPTPDLYYPFGKIPCPDGIELHSFVSDVRPLYNAANLVLIPTPVSAGTNIKALEAMAMQRAILSTPSGIHGIGLAHGVSAWIAEGAVEFAASARQLLSNSSLRRQLAQRARAIAEQHFDWAPIARKQEALWRSLLR